MEKLTLENGNTYTVATTDPRVARWVEGYGPVARSEADAVALQSELDAWGVKSYSALTLSEAQDLGI